MRILTHLDVTGSVAWLTMRSQAAPPPQVVAVLLALCVGSTPRVASESPGPRCDNGKLFLDRDLPADAAYWDCAAPTWLESTQALPSINSVYDPEPNKQICMDRPISYNRSIPSSGAFRPIKAESGEYLYCPPQRWLNNLHHGAIVLLHHPCAPLRERHLLSGLARSCLPGYIITSHPQLSRNMPVALVSWGRTLELATAASTDICDWLQTTKTTRDEYDDEAPTMKYNLLLIRSAGLDQLERLTRKQESLRRCCEETISSLLKRTVNIKRKRRKKEIKSGDKRDSSREVEEKNNRRRGASNVADILTNQMNQIPSLNHTGSSEAHSDPQRRTSSDPVFPKQTFQSKTSKLNPILSSWINNSVSNVSSGTLDTDSVGLGAAKPETKRLVVQSETPQRRPAGMAVLTGGANSKQNSSVGLVSAAASKNRGTNSVKQDLDTAKHKREDEVVDVKEREVEYEQKHVTNSTSKSQSESQSQEKPQQKCDGCSAGGSCDCTRRSGAQVHAVNRGLPRTPRSEEAAWAAAALGFLLVLLTLSVLHTRLYRYWRTTPSLYWHDPRQDYDSVADVIRRRLRIAKRRRKRGRRQECVLLPSSSSSDEHP